MDSLADGSSARFNAFLATMQRAGLRAALADLLETTEYRFIAIFRFRGDRANASVFFDRENPGILTLDDVPASATYCTFARGARSAFVTEDAMEDERLVGHVAREHVRAYAGVPILTPEGEILGTLCHYDLVPRDPSQIDLALMCEVASALEQGGLVPPYPQQPQVVV
jgi:GAF domain-containing protein